jgi:hypothetical protein
MYIRGRRQRTKSFGIRPGIRKSRGPGEGRTSEASIIVQAFILLSLLMKWSRRLMVDISFIRMETSPSVSTWNIYFHGE